MRAHLALPLMTFLVIPAACKKDAAAPAATPPPAATSVVPTAVVPTAAAPDGRTVELAVTDEGFVPANVTVKANQPVTFKVTRKTDETCARDLLIDGTDIKLALPLGETVAVTWTPTKAGSVKFGCAMDKMIGGVLLVE